VAHDVEAPHGVPVLVGELVEADLARDADVVDEDVEAAEGLGRVPDDVLGRSRLGEIGDYGQCRAGLLACLLRALAVAAAHGDERAFGRELARYLEPDPGRRTGDDADAVVEPEIHAATVAPCRRRPFSSCATARPTGTLPGGSRGRRTRRCTEGAAHRPTRWRTSSQASPSRRCTRAISTALARRPRSWPGASICPSSSTRRSASAISDRGRARRSTNSRRAGRARGRAGATATRARATSRIIWRWPRASRTPSPASPPPTRVSVSSWSPTAARCA